MLKTKDIILQMNDKDYEALLGRFRKTKGEKYITLLILLRQNVLNDEQISQNLGLKKGAYYTLKSRLHDKIQEHTTHSIVGKKENILKQLDNIPTLLYDTPKETAIAILCKLEEDLLQFNMPWELTMVYSALKKLHIHSNKYYQYSQRYNKQVAFAMAAEKTRELATDFFKYIGNFYVTRDNSWLAYIAETKLQVTNYVKLYPSDSMILYKYIVDISFALFIPLPEKTKEDEPIENMLDKMKGILTAHENNQSYKYLLKLHELLSFEYYHSLRLTKKADEYFQKLNNDIPSVMLLNFYSCSGHFLRSKAEHYVLLNMQGRLFDENKKLVQSYSPSQEDLPNYVAYYKYLAISAVYAGNYVEAISLLNTLTSTVSLRQCTHAEIEVKLFLAYCYCVVKNFDYAHTVMRGVMYKIRDAKLKDDYENAYFFIRMLNILMDKKYINTEKRIISFKRNFLLFNQGKTKMLEYLPINDTMLINLLRENYQKKITN